ncbi:hypothetical protein [Bacteroides sp. 519]|uniref:hypothetical protein n=1 Tax=Bacteroides sp. 519 TaxID=2302937 RepID=UPI0013D13D74|nr:hypothetical protein [Bacteroides sp. 519]NDV60542.1 hypothetical protein [Bacteroides sp. 519]
MIDLLLTLQPHGWSSCLIGDKNKRYEFLVTHVFSNPYSDLIQVLSELINGQQSATLLWYDEPGGHRIEFMVRQENVLVSIDEFPQLCYEEPKSYQLVFEFEMELKQLIALFYFQLQKTEFLLRYKSFSENRAEYFPYQEFCTFKRIAKTFLEL